MTDIVIPLPASDRREGGYPDEDAGKSIYL